MQLLHEDRLMDQFFFLILFLKWQVPRKQKHRWNKTGKRITYRVCLNLLLITPVAQLGKELTLDKVFGHSDIWMYSHILSWGLCFPAFSLTTQARQIASLALARLALPSQAGQAMPAKKPYVPSGICLSHVFKELGGALGPYYID